jgi:hypothetical protein
MVVKTVRFDIFAMRRKERKKGGRAEVYLRIGKSVVAAQDSVNKGPDVSFIMHLQHRSAARPRGNY